MPGSQGWTHPALDPEQVEQIVSALDAGPSKASVCRGFKVPRSTLLDTLARLRQQDRASHLRTS